MSNDQMARKEYSADLTDLVEKHGCAHFVQAGLEPFDQIEEAIRRLETTPQGRHEKACLRDFRKLREKYKDVFLYNWEVTVSADGLPTETFLVEEPREGLAKTAAVEMYMRRGYQLNGREVRYDAKRLGN
jgi:hypothetical protein